MPRFFSFYFVILKEVARKIFRSFLNGPSEPYFHLRSHLKPSLWKIYNERGLNGENTDDFYARELSILMENFRHETKL